MVADNKGANKNRRVTSTELHQAIIEQNAERVEMERRLSGKLGDLTTAVTQIAKQPEICQAYFEHINKKIDTNIDDIGVNKTAIVKNREKSRLWERILGLGTAIAAALGIYFGER